MTITGNVSAGTNVGYWVEAFLDIVRGDKPLSADRFNQYAEILFSHRVKGNPLHNNPSEIERKHAVSELYNVYSSMNGETDLVRRAALLNTLFMQTLAENIDNPLSKEAKKYVTKTSLPAALDACNAKNLLEIKEYKQWLKNYRLGCSLPATIESQIGLYSGYSEAEKAKLSEKRAAISMNWYNAFKGGNVTKADIKSLHDKLELNFNRKNHENIVLDNSYMQDAFQAYINHASDFPPEKYVPYWGAILKALEVFLERAQ